MACSSAHCVISGVCRACTTQRARPRLAPQRPRTPATMSAVTALVSAPGVATRLQSQPQRAPQRAAAHPAVARRRCRRGRTTTAAAADDSEVAVFRFTLGSDAADEMVPRVVGTAGAVLLLLNHVLSGEAASEAQASGPVCSLLMPHIAVCCCATSPTVSLWLRLSQFLHTGSFFLSVAPAACRSCGPRAWAPRWPPSPSSRPPSSGGSRSCSRGAGARRRPPAWRARPRCLRCRRGCLRRRSR